MQLSVIYHFGPDTATPLATAKGVVVKQAYSRLVLCAAPASANAASVDVRERPVHRISAVDADASHELRVRRLDTVHSIANHSRVAIVHSAVVVQIGHSP
jgi:hypothetical protein